MEILIATNNLGKVKEFTHFFADLPIKLRSLREFPEIEDVEETGSTYAENAVLKAKTYSLKTNLWALADDSGLEVEVLGNAPGIFSARYAGENASNNEKINKLLTQIEKSSKKNRNAKFICVIALTNEKGEVQVIVEGVCEGHITDKPCGINGFGYDPVFIPNDYRETFGELSEEIKQKISHRANAVRKIIDFLLKLT
jgi:XTP/dITP diphosphohydrolase